MCSEAKLLASRFREVTLDGTWIANTNFKDQLQDLNWNIATKKIHNLNTIALLAQHLNYYVAGVLNVFMGGPLDIRDAQSFDFAELGSQQEWDDFLNRFWDHCEQFAEAVEQMSLANLSQDFVDKKYGSYYRNIDGMIEHCYYHLGQIVLIKKLCSQRDDN